MVKRSLQVSLPGIQQAKQAFALKGWTQENLAGEVSLKTRQPIWRFFTGQPVNRQVFLEICSVLELDWRAVAIDPPDYFLDEVKLVRAEAMDLESLVAIVRSQRQEKIQDQCGILQLLDISRPVSIDDIYIDVSVLQEIASQQSVAIEDLQTLGPEDFDRFGLGAIDQKQIPGTQAVEMYTKLRVLGKPGSGKTTFLQYLAIQCNRGAFAANQVPIFITLRHFAEESRDRDEFSLLSYIQQEWLISDITDPLAAETLLHAGRVLLLLDGMDEVMHQDSAAVLREIRRFTDKYHKNGFVATCRTASQKLTLRGFTNVEIAPFTQDQIATFAQKWFVAFTKTTLQAGQAQSTRLCRSWTCQRIGNFASSSSHPSFCISPAGCFMGKISFRRSDRSFTSKG